MVYKHISSLVDTEHEISLIPQPKFSDSTEVLWWNSQVCARLLYQSQIQGIHTCDISLFRRDLPIFEQISLFGISKFPYITYTSPYFKFKISLFEIKNFLLCLIILPILKSKSPYLASQMYHMYEGIPRQG